MRDYAHHPKYIQKKLLQETRREEEVKSKNPKIENVAKESLIQSNGKKFDPNHRTPRIFTKRDYH